ncbi:MAG TPA: ROK family transcriptional regulator [Vicinamibacterales bacterium]|jgi:predicted NBD/HSP70 family sugar kinase|nr:ROK family transcriptional regulator [Vicinamibacterales bacterium]
MRKIDPAQFHVATRGTSRDINRRIALTLVRARQPISRADLARAMGVRRSAVSLIVTELLKKGLIIEGATGETLRGRKPTFLYIDARRRTVVAVDIRASQTFVMPADLLGQPLGGVTHFPTLRDPKALVPALAERIKRLLAEHGGAAACEGIGVVVPGMVEHMTMRILHAPTLGWRNVDLLEPLSSATDLPVQIENSGRACALAQLWARHAEPGIEAGDLVFVSISDGVGVGVIVRGELVRGRHNIAGEFAHVPLSLDGPRCSCGATGCWEAYVSNRATLTRYFGRAADLSGPVPADQLDFTIEDLIARARAGDAKAAAALQTTGRYLGLGLASLVNALDPGCVYIGGEITAAWDVIGTTVRAALRERALTPGAAAADIRLASAQQYPRLQGAAALVVAPAFAAPVVA